MRHAGDGSPKRPRRLVVTSDVNLRHRDSGRSPTRRDCKSRAGYRSAKLRATIAGVLLLVYPARTGCCERKLSCVHHSRSSPLIPSTLSRPGCLIAPARDHGWTRRRRAVGRTSRRCGSWPAKDDRRCRNPSMPSPNLRRSTPAPARGSSRQETPLVRSRTDRRTCTSRGSGCRRNGDQKALPQRFRAIRDNRARCITPGQRGYRAA